MEFLVGLLSEGFINILLFHFMDNLSCLTAQELCNIQ